MSAITTMGWGVQGGLVTTMGWGGQPIGQPALPVPYKPEIIDSTELAPAVDGGSLRDAPATLASLELRPDTGAETVYDVPQPQGDHLVPAVEPGRLTDAATLEAEELQPQIGDSEAEPTPEAESVHLVPELGDAQGEDTPDFEGDDLVPDITDTEGGDC